MNNTQLKLIFVTRVFIGWIFFYSGWTKVLTFFTPAKDWSATMFLSISSGPLAELFTHMAGNVWIDYLNAYGQLAIGFALLLGLFTRFASFWGIILMILYYLAGFPPENSFLVDEHIIYVTVLLIISVFGGGRVFGLDLLLERAGLVQKHPWLLKLLG